MRSSSDIPLKRGVVGLDLSMTNTGMCYIPHKWDGKYETLRTDSFGTKKSEMTFGKRDLKTRDQLSRYIAIANRVVGFVRHVETDLFSIEDYAYSKARQGSASLTKLGELGGAIKTQLFLAFRSVPAVIGSTSARNSVFGRLRRGDPKGQVRDILGSFGVRFSNLDEMDAFVVGYAFYCEVYGVTSMFLPKGNLW